MLPAKRFLQNTYLKKTAIACIMNRSLDNENMLIRKTISIGLLILTLYLLAFSQDQEPKREPSTPEERKRFVTLVHKLEKTPLDESLTSEVRWAVGWLNDVPDINVTVCPNPLGRFVLESYRYRSRISTQFALGMAAFLIEHPQKAADNTATYLAGVESALKAYRSILKSKPEAKSNALDELVGKEAEGELEDFVRDASRGCDTTNQT